MAAATTKVCHGGHTSRLLSGRLVHVGYPEANMYGYPEADMYLVGFWVADMHLFMQFFCYLFLRLTIKIILFKKILINNKEYTFC